MTHFPVSRCGSARFGFRRHATVITSIYLILDKCMPFSLLSFFSLSQTMSSKFTNFFKHSKQRQKQNNRTQPSNTTRFHKFKSFLSRLFLIRRRESQKLSSDDLNPADHPHS